MCGIAAVLGKKGAARLVHAGLRSLEYRGYDSCGLAWLDGGLRVAKAVGPVDALEAPDGPETAALGHTRWATHGGVTVANAHPHLDCPSRVAVVHNGILANFQGLRRELESRGHRFRSETDSECLAHLWEEAKGSGLDRLRSLRGALQGTYSIAILDAGEEAVYFAKQRNPLWVARGAGFGVLASDAVALRPHVAAAAPLEDGDFGRLDAGGLQVFDAQGRAVERTPYDVGRSDDRADRAGYEHFMLKEIHETPSALNRLVAAHVRPDRPYVELGLPAKLAGAWRRALFLGAGTSHHAGLLGVEYLRRLARLSAEARTSPEYKDAPDTPPEGTLLVALSQSGETLDTLQALHRLSSHAHPMLALTNHPASSIGRLADHALALRSGIEISVAATKTFLSQVLLLYLLALAKGRQEGVLTDSALAHAAVNLHQLPRALQHTLDRAPQAVAMARELAGAENLFLLAKGLLLPAALEGALKLKEIAYQHAEAYPAGELKHGPFALLTPATPVVFLVAPGPHEEGLWGSLHEVHARGAPTYAIAMEGARDPGELADGVFWVPAVEPDLQPLVFANALHLVSYWVAKARALPIDKPRNLAKSVTVE